MQIARVIPKHKQTCFFQCQVPHFSIFLPGIPGMDTRGGPFLDSLIRIPNNSSSFQTCSFHLCTFTLIIPKTCLNLFWYSLSFSVFCRLFLWNLFFNLSERLYVLKLVFFVIFGFVLCVCFLFFIVKTGLL